MKDFEVPRASDIQVGGGHYAKYKIQPTVFIHANDVPFIEGNLKKRNSTGTVFLILYCDSSNSRIT